MKIDYRQGLISAPEGFLKISDSDPKCVSIVVADKPIIATIANASMNYLISETVSIDKAWGPIENMMTNYLYWDINTRTGEVTRGSTVFPIIVSKVQPEYARKDQMWWNGLEDRMFAYDGENWVKVLRVLAGTFKTGKVITPEQLKSQVGLNDSGIAGFILFADGRPLKNDIGDYLTSKSTLTVSSGAIELEDNTITAIAKENMEQFTVVSLHNGFAYPAMGDFESAGASEPLALTADAVIQNEKVKLITEGIIVRHSGWAWPPSAIGNPVYCDPRGQLCLQKFNVFKNIRVGVVVSTDGVLLKFESETDIPKEFRNLTAIDVAKTNDAINQVEKNNREITLIRSEISELFTNTNEKAPFYHTHSTADIRGLSESIANKADVNHSHSIEEIPGILEAINSRASVNHKHSLFSLTDVDSSAQPEDGMYLKFSAATNSWVASPYLARVETIRSIFHKISTHDSGKIFEHEQNTDSIINLPNNAPRGFEIELIQNGDGRVEFQVEDGASMFHMDNHVRTSGKRAYVKLIVIRNNSGASAEYILTGNTMR